MDRREEYEVHKVVKNVTKRIEKDVVVAAPLFIQSTGNGELARLLKEEEDKMGTILGWKYKVVERGGG